MLSKVLHSPRCSPGSVCKDKLSCSVCSAGKWQHQTHGQDRGGESRIPPAPQEKVVNPLGSSGQRGGTCTPGAVRGMQLLEEEEEEQQKFGSPGAPWGWGQITREMPGNLLLKQSQSLIIIPKAQSSSRHTPGSLKDLSRLKG